MSTELLLPKAVIYRTTDNIFIAEIRGDNARNLTEHLIGYMIDNEPDAEYDISVSDERCPSCFTEFWHEAAEGEPGDWHCPNCYGPLPHLNEEVSA